MIRTLFGGWTASQEYSRWVFVLFSLAISAIIFSSNSTLLPAILFGKKNLGLGINFTIGEKNVNL